MITKNIGCKKLKFYLKLYTLEKERQEWEVVNTFCVKLFFYSTYPDKSIDLVACIVYYLKTVKD